KQRKRNTATKVVLKCLLLSEFIRKEQALSKYRTFSLFMHILDIAATTRLQARNFDTYSACSVNFARRFFLRFSRSAQVISGSPHNAHSRIRAKPCSGSAATITLMV